MPQLGGGWARNADDSLKEVLPLRDDRVLFVETGS